MDRRTLLSLTFLMLLLLAPACSREPAPGAATAAASATVADPLPSWNQRAARESIVAFVDKVMREGGPDFVPPAERIAVFDNDGTLWAEQPIYPQLVFALDRVKAMAPEHPEWLKQDPFKSVLAGDIKGVMANSEQAMQLIAATHVNNTTAEFEQVVKDWIGTAKHPTTGRLFTEMVYQPMLEMMAYLRANGFKTYVVSGGGVEFMRPWTERVYGIPPEQVVGSRSKMKYDVRGGTPVLLRLPTIDLNDDGAGKPVGIQQAIGRHPIIAFGNSDGDFQMLEWTTSHPGPRLGVLVHHTDAEREWAYDRESPIGRLARGLDEAGPRGWVVVDMKNEWKTIYK